MNAPRATRRGAPPGFLEGVAVALLASLAGGALHALLWLGFAAVPARALTLALVGLGYLGYLLWRAPQAAGRLSVLLAGAAITAGTLLVAPHWLLAVQLGLLWLLRSLLLQRDPVAALVDLGLVLLGLGAGLWAVTASGSLAAALWSFFLVQALFPLLGDLAAGGRGGRQVTEDGGNERFERAERCAAASLRRLAVLRDAP